MIASTGSADLVLLSDDIVSIDPAKIRDTKVLKPIVGGKIAWDADTMKVTETQKLVYEKSSGCESAGSQPTAKPPAFLTTAEQGSRPELQFKN